MTRKDYELLAKVIEGAYYLEETARLTLSKDLADELSIENPRFDYDRFLSACGVK